MRLADRSWVCGSSQSCTKTLAANRRASVRVGYALLRKGWQAVGLSAD